MSAFETTRAKGRGRITTALGSDSLMCELHGGARKGRAGNRIIWILGRPAARVCLDCEKELKAIWDGALDS